MRGIYIGSFLLLGIIVFFAAGLAGVFEPFEGTATPEWPPLPLAIFIGGAVCYLGFWLWMIVDFFRRTHLKHKLCWGLGLFVTHILTAIPYFLFIYVPWARKSSAERLPLDSQPRPRPTGFLVLSVFFFFCAAGGLLSSIAGPDRAQYPVVLKAVVAIYILSLTVFATGLWRVSAWVVKASWFWFLSLVLIMVAMNLYFVGFPPLSFLGALVLFGGFAGLIVWYVTRTMRARAEAATRNA